jgi:uncharacterized protein YecE (DUF72 family)
MLKIGTAGWSIRTEHAPRFGAGKSHLSRYATRLNAVEINSSFYRPHKPQIYARWALETPDGFSFSVKMPKHITHELKLANCAAPLAEFIGQCSELGGKLGCVLVQLPPSLKFDAKIAPAFLGELRDIYAGAVALEPRHESWFTREAETTLKRFEIARVAADPIPGKMRNIAQAASPGGYSGTEYWRLHGSPKIYYANYASDFLDALAERLSSSARSKDVWCIFDNTAVGHATNNALELTAKTKTPRS